MIHTLISLTQDLSHWPHSNAPWVVKELLFDQKIFHIFCIWNVFHLYEHSDVVWVCAFLKDSPHVLQEIDFCFVWTLMWYFNWSSSTKVLLQYWQENGLSTKWYFFCASQESLLVWMICCIVCMKKTLFLCEPHCVFSELGLFWNIFHRRGRQILTSV